MHMCSSEALQQKQVFKLAISCIGAKKYWAYWAAQKHDANIVSSWVSIGETVGVD